VLVGGERVHVRCLARETQLEAVERQRDSEVARARAQEILERSRRLLANGQRQRTCIVCEEPLTGTRALLFSGAQLVHAACWRSEPPPVPGV